ncbi:hypothetical protein [Marinobacter sp. C2H3]|uniref:hypothetical protein n=1 Tax=Marinobacter sp. C2H3 TaxID=3119003 RepID=UPI00300EBB87
MTQIHNAIAQPLPSSILHNSTEVRAQHTRAAARQAVQFISRKVRLLNRKAPVITPDMPQVQGGH